MKRLAVILAAGITLAGPVWADFQPVREEASFRALVEGAELTRFAVRLQVLPEGLISGRGFGQTVGGVWEWRDGYFCRTLEWGSGGDPYNCQLVLRNGDRLRFISDQGRGDRADFRVR
jgi:hypothetical protein